MADNRCRYCAVPIPDFAEPWPEPRQEVAYRTRAEILASTDLWDRDATIHNVTVGAWRPDLYSDTAPIPVRIRVDGRKPLSFCSDLHAKAFKGNRSAVRESLGEFRDDDGETVDVGPVQVHPDQGSLL